ncbi:hypothetical protein [Rhodococcus opacus]|uniref:hypothetical protein n=1 Tax=Rhodococcus opacus TaxID=37919 RepID=UPI002952AB40|nr:hypothetical protein [Rhodococcus opacus]MDV7090641.1 hypothetical protein [Rhodococcus opacus]
MRIAPALAALALCTVLVGCATDSTTTPAAATAEPSSLPGVAALPVKFDTAAVAARCQSLLEAVDGFRQLGETDTDARLDEILAYSQSSAEWSTTTKADRAVTEAAFEQAKSGSC